MTVNKQQKDLSWTNWIFPVILTCEYSSSSDMSMFSKALNGATIVDIHNRSNLLQSLQWRCKSIFNQQNHCIHVKNTPNSLLIDLKFVKKNDPVDFLKIIHMNNDVLLTCMISDCASNLGRCYWTAAKNGWYLEMPRKTDHCYSCCSSRISLWFL